MSRATQLIVLDDWHSCPIGIPPTPSKQTPCIYSRVYPDRTNVGFRRAVADDLHCQATLTFKWDQTFSLNSQWLAMTKRIKLPPRRRKPSSRNYSVCKRLLKVSTRRHSRQTSGGWVGLICNRKRTSMINRLGAISDPG